jgi:carotenoid cleavage dioxygenase-like enzyme
MNRLFTYATTISGRWTNYRESLSFIRRTRGGSLHAHTAYPSYTFTQPRPATGQLTRYRLDMNTGTSKKEILPSAIPGETRVYDCGPGRYTSEPIFVPRSPDAGEADGYILCVINDAGWRVFGGIPANNRFLSS